MGVRGQSPSKWGSGAEPPETEQVFMIIKTFLAEILLIKCCIYNIIRSPTSVDIFVPAYKLKLKLNLKAGLKISIN